MASEAPHAPEARARHAESALLEFVSSALRLDLSAIERGLERLRRQHPGESDHALARRCARRAAWLAGGASLVLGLPDHPALTIPAAMAESALLGRLQRVAVAQIVLLHEQSVLAGGLDPVGVLRAIVGGHCAAEAAAALGTAGGRKALQAATRHLVGIDTAHAVQALLKGAGARAGGTTLIIKAIPIVGAIVAGVTAARAVRREADRALAALGPGREPGGRGAARVVELRRPGSSAARRVALGLTVAGIRAGDAVVAAAGRPRRAISAFLAEARARARTPGADGMRSAA